jgi:hypothetical protein
MRTYDAELAGPSALRRHEASPLLLAGSRTHYGTSAWRSGGACVFPVAPERAAGRRRRWRAWRDSWTKLTCGQRALRQEMPERWVRGDPLPRRADRWLIRSDSAGVSARRDCPAGCAAGCRSRWRGCRGVVGTALSIAGCDRHNPLGRIDNGRASSTDSLSKRELAPGPSIGGRDAIKGAK